MTTHWTRVIESPILILFLCGTCVFADTSCGPKDGKPHDCVKVTECSILYQKIRRPITAENIEMLRKLNCGFDNKLPKVCCPRIEHKNLHLLTQHECGEYEASRIFGGQEADLNELPWMALLSYKIGNRRKFLCGGSLINKKYVLTAAHCVNAYLLGVRIGEHNIRKKKDCVIFFGQEQCSEDVQDFRIERAIAHKNYERKSLSNDIALLRLQGTVNIARANAKPICLPTTPNLREVNLTNFNMTVAGWGATEDSKSSDVLLKVIVPVVSNEECKTVHRYLTGKKLCAGDLKSDSCKGDSGGPLMSLQIVEKTPVYVQFGIVSYGTGKACGGASHGVYTRVTEYMDWILDNLES